MWCFYFADVQRPLDAVGYDGCIFADDLTADASCPDGLDVEIIKFSADRVQDEVHTWGAANSVVFDASKEHKMIFRQEGRCWQIQTSGGLF